MEKKREENAPTTQPCEAPRTCLRAAHHRMGELGPGGIAVGVVGVEAKGWTPANAAAQRSSHTTTSHERGAHESRGHAHHHHCTSGFTRRCSCCSAISACNACSASCSRRNPSRRRDICRRKEISRCRPSMGSERWRAVSGDNAGSGLNWPALTLRQRRRRAGVVLRMGGLLLGGRGPGHFWPDALPALGPILLTRESAIRKRFDLRAVLHGHRSFAGGHLANE